MSRVTVAPNLLRWARERACLALDEVAARFPRYPDWERGESKPTLKQLENFARLTSTPFGYLFLDSPPVETLPVPDFRTIRDKPVSRPSPDLLETVQTMERRQAWMREYLQEEGGEPLDFVGSASLEDAPESVAARIRTTLGLEGGWAEQVATWEQARGLLREHIEDAGILVFINGVVGNNTHRPLDPEEFRGFVLSDDLAPLIFVNGADAKAAQMFTMAHELAHLWLDLSGIFDLHHLMPTQDRAELFCNRVAAEFLVPQAEFEPVWRANFTSSRRFLQLARRFKVSQLVVARRALDLGFISRDEFLAFYRAHLSDSSGGTESAGGDFWKVQTYRVGDRFARTVVRAAKEGRLLYREAYSLVGLQGAAFQKLADRLTP
ncbi:MAG: hypothetical protein AMXMBFR33_20000 [Candidatus Xenobia bacterium]